MSYDFDYFHGTDLSYPRRPAKPRLNGNPSPTEVRSYADELEAYEKANIDYKAAVADYSSKMNIRMEEFQTKLQDDYDISEKQFWVIWNLAYEKGHSSGLSEVYYYFDEFYDMASAFAAAEG